MSKSPVRRPTLGRSKPSTPGRPISRQASTTASPHVVHTFSARVPPGAKKFTPPPAGSRSVVRMSTATAPGLMGVVMEPAKGLDGNEETFVTQRAGKIIQQPQLPALQNERTQSMFESRRTLQSTLLLQKKKEMQAVQAELEKRRLEFAKRMADCKERQEGLRAKQKQIRDRVTKFEKFLKENDAKRQRANLKAQTEKKLREQKEQELYTLQRQLHQEQLKYSNIQHLIKKYQIYESYLQGVVDILPPDYLDVNEPHINDILMRHKTLVETNEDLMGAVQTSQDDIESEQARLGELVKDKNDLILVHNSTLGTQQKRLDRIKQECAYLEQRLEERDNTGKERMRMLSESKLAINNIFNRISLRPQADAPPAPVPAVVVPATNAQPQQGSLAAHALHPQPASQHPAPPPQQAGQSGTDLAGAVINLLIPPPPLYLQKDYADNSAKALAERLHAIQDRVLDLQYIALRAEQAMLAQEHHPSKGKKAAALAAGVGPAAAGSIAPGGGSGPGGAAALAAEVNAVKV
ncbi:hypothetical protein HDU86_006114 [Geranomyces michiganensis]|nr:hypothetical protein HDU86_006114 [Geranomyces michiganensis]